MSGYNSVPDFGPVVWVISVLVGFGLLIATFIGFFSLPKKPYSFYLLFVVIAGMITLVCIDIDHLMILIGCGFPLVLITTVLVVIETGVRRLGPKAVRVATGLTLFTFILFLILAPVAKTVSSMCNTRGGGPVIKSQ
jgi:hypothetical protein